MMPTFKQLHFNCLKFTHIKQTELYTVIQFFWQDWYNELSRTCSYCGASLEACTSTPKSFLLLILPEHPIFITVSRFFCTSCKVNDCRFTLLYASGCRTMYCDNWFLLRTMPQEHVNVRPSQMGMLPGTACHSWTFQQPLYKGRCNLIWWSMPVLKNVWAHVQKHASSVDWRLLQLFAAILGV